MRKFLKEFENKNLAKLAVGGGAIAASEVISYAKSS